MSLRIKPQKQGLNNSRSSTIERRDKISNIPIYSDEELDNFKSKSSETEGRLLYHQSKVRDVRTELLEKALAEKTKLGLVNLGTAKQSSALQALCCYSPESHNSPSDSPREDSFDLERIVREKRIFKIAETAKEKEDRYQFGLQQLNENISEKAEVDSEESSKPLRSILKVKTFNDSSNHIPLIEQQKLDTSVINMSAFSSISFENIEDEDKFLYGDSVSDELTKKESDDLFSINRSERNLSENSGWSDDDDFVHPCNKVSEKESWTNFTPRPMGNYHIKSPISEMKDAFYDKCIKEKRNRVSVSSDVHEDTIIDLKLPSNAWKNALILEESNTTKISNSADVGTNSLEKGSKKQRFATHWEKDDHIQSADKLSEYKQNLKEKHSNLEKNKFHKISKLSPNPNPSTVPKYGSSSWKNVSNWKDRDTLQTKSDSIVDKSSEKPGKDPSSNIQSDERKDKSSDSDSDSSDSEPKSPSAVELLMYHGFKTKRSSPSAGLSKSERVTTSAQKPNSVQPAELSCKQSSKLNFQLDNKPHSNQPSVSDSQLSNNSDAKQHNISTYEKKQKSISPQITKTSLQFGRSHMQSVKPISMQLKPRLITELKKSLKVSQSLKTQPAKYISAQEKPSILNFKTSNQLSQATLKLLPHPVQKIQISKTSVGNKRVKENQTCAKDFSSTSKDININSDGKKSSFGNELNSSSTPDFRKINSQKGQSISKCKMLKSDHHSQATAKVKKEVIIKHKNLPEKELCDQLPKRYWSESHKYRIESPSSQKEQYERLPSSSNQTTPERVTVESSKKRACAKYTQEKKLSTWKKESHESLQSTGTDSHKRHRSKSPDYYRERKRHIQSSTEKERSSIKGSHEKYLRKGSQRQNSHEKSQRERFERNSEAYYAKTSERDFCETVSSSSDNSRDNAQEKVELRKNVEKKSPISHQQDADRYLKQRYYGIENITDSADDISISLLLKKVHHTNTLFSDTQENNLSLPNSATEVIQNSHSLAPGTPISHPGSSQSALAPSPLPQEQLPVLPPMNCPVSTYPHPLAYEQPMEMQPLPYPVVDNNYNHPFMPPPMCSSYELSYNPYMVQPQMLPPEPQMHQYHPLHATADITPSHTTHPYSFPEVTMSSTSDTKPYFSTLRTNLTVIPLQSDLNTVQQQPSVVTTSESNCKTAELLNTQAKSEVCSSPINQEEQSCISLQRQKELMTRKTDVKSQMSILSKEFERLRKMQGEMMRKKQREKDGHKDQLIMENNKLQDEISGQLSNLVKEAKEIERELQKIPKKKAIPPVELKTPDANIAKVVSEIKSTKESMDSAEEFYFEYFDPGSHWCKLCNEVQPTIFRMLEHLQSNKHKQHMDPYDRPWIPDPPKKNENGKAEKKVITAAKGTQFILPVEGFYCSLCKQCFGDQICAEEHLMSYEHNFSYGKYLAENPVYERRWNLDKSAGLAVIVKQQTKRHAEEKKAEQAKRQKKNEKETQKQQVSYEEKKHIKLPKEQEETPRSMMSAKHKSKGIKLTLIGEKSKMKHNESKKSEKIWEKKTAKHTSIVHIGKAPNYKSRIAAKFDSTTQDVKVKFSETDVENVSNENSTRGPNSLSETISRNEIAFVNVDSTASNVSIPITTASLTTTCSSAEAFIISNTSTAVSHSTSATIFNKTLSATDTVSASETPVLSNVTFTNTPVTTTNPSMSVSGVSCTNVPAKAVTSNSLFNEKSLSGECFSSLSSVLDLADINLPGEEIIPTHAVSLNKINLAKVEATPLFTESSDEINLPKVEETISLIDCLNEINIQKRKEATLSSAISVDKIDLPIAATPTPTVSLDNIELPEEVIPSLPINLNNIDLPKKEATPSPTLSLDKIDLLKEKVPPSLSISLNEIILPGTDHMQLLPGNQEIIKIKTVDMQTSSEKSSINKSKKIKALQEKYMKKEVLSKKHKAIKENIVLPMHGPLTEEEEDFILLGINKEDMQPLVVPKPPPPPLLIQQHSTDKTESDVIKSTSDSGYNASHENASVMCVSIYEANDVTENPTGKENSSSANNALCLPSTYSCLTSSDSLEAKQKCNESHIVAVQTGSLEVELAYNVQDSKENISATEITNTSLPTSSPLLKNELPSQTSQERPHFLDIVSSNCSNTNQSDSQSTHTSISHSYVQPDTFSKSSSEERVYVNSNLVMDMKSENSTKAAIYQSDDCNSKSQTVMSNIFKLTNENQDMLLEAKLQDDSEISRLNEKNIQMEQTDVQPVGELYDKIPLENSNAYLSINSKEVFDGITKTLIATNETEKYSHEPCQETNTLEMKNVSFNMSTNILTEVGKKEEILKTCENAQSSSRSSQYIHSEIKLNDTNWNEKLLTPEEDTFSINENYSVLGHDSLPENINQISDDEQCSHKSFSTSNYKTLSSCKGTNVSLNEDSSSTDIESSSSKECALFDESSSSKECLLFDKNKVAINELQSSKNVPLETKLSTVVMTTSHNNETVNVDSFVENKDSISVSSFIPSDNSNPSKEIILNEDTNQSSNETAILTVETEHSCIDSGKNTSGGYESSKEYSNRKQLEFLPNDDYKTSVTSKNLQHTEFVEGDSYLEEQSMCVKMDSTQIESSDLSNTEVYITKKSSDETGFDKSISNTESQTLTSVGCKIQHQTEAVCTEVTFSSISDDLSSSTVLTSPCEVREVIHENKSENASQNVKKVIADVLEKVCYFIENESYKNNEDVNSCYIFSSPVDRGSDSKNSISNNSETVLSVSKDFEIYEQKEIQSCIMESSGNFNICEANSLIDNNNIDSKFVCNSSDMSSDAFSVVHKQSSKEENEKKEEKVTGCHGTFELIGKNCGLIENQNFSVGKEISKAENSLLEIVNVANDISDAFPSQQVAKCISEEKTESLSDIILASETLVNENSLSLMTTAEKLEESQCSVTKELQILHSDLDVNLGSVLTSKRDTTISRLENSVFKQCSITPDTTNFENVNRVDNSGVSNIFKPGAQQEIHIGVNASNDETEANNILNIGMEIKDEGNHKCLTKCDITEGKKKYRTRWDVTEGRGSRKCLTKCNIKEDKRKHRTTWDMNEDKVQTFTCVMTNSEINQDSTVNSYDRLENVEFCSGKSVVISNDIITDAVRDISSFTSNTGDLPKYNEKNKSYQKYNLCTESNMNSKELYIINPVTQDDGNKHSATEISTTLEVFPDKNKQNYSSSKEKLSLNEKPQFLDFSDADCISLRPDNSHKRTKFESQETYSADNEYSSRKSSIMVIDRRDLMKDNLRSKESNRWILLKDENIPNIILFTPDLKISGDEKLQEGSTSVKDGPSIIISQGTSSVIHKNITVETSEQNILTKAENNSLSYGKVATDMQLVSSNDLPASLTTADIENSNMTSEINSSNGSESTRDKEMESKTEIDTKHEVCIESSKTSSKEEEETSETVKVDTICESK